MVLEVGAGGGYNMLPLFDWGVKHVDIVEPNRKGREDIEKLFSSNNIIKDKYDIIIAEGFVQHLDNTEEILKVLAKFTRQDSIVIITCSDEIGLYVERMKCLVANYLVHDINEWESKVDLPVSAGVQAPAEMPRSGNEVMSK